MQQAFSKHTFKLIPTRSIDLPFYRDSCVEVYNILVHYNLDFILSCEQSINVALVSEFYNNLHTSDDVSYRTRVAKRSLDFSPEILQAFLGCHPSTNDFVFYPSLPGLLPLPFEHVSIATMHQSLFGRPRPDSPNTQLTNFSSLEVSAGDNALYKVVVNYFFPIVSRALVVLRPSHMFLLYAIRQTLNINISLNIFHCIIHFIQPVQQTIHMPFGHLITAWLESMGIDVTQGATFPVVLQPNVSHSGRHCEVSDDDECASGSPDGSGCDGSVLLDDAGSFVGEKGAGPNANSLRGFNVIDTIKTAVELLCPNTVSCADILAIAARDGVVLLGGPSWSVPLGRRDSTTASLSAANSNLPSPVSSLSQLISAFAAKGLNARDMTALSGAHTIGQARCVNFRSHIYSDANIDAAFAAQRQGTCPSSGGDNNLAPLDAQTANAFDNAYFQNLLSSKGLLHSDQELFNNGTQDSLVRQYATNPSAFAADFAAAMVKMSNIGPLTGSSGEIRTNCRRVN
ncbi:hypothetical protein ZIOFF_042570 [Zingiber officinale]|uniref:peroxidase n=1 Tax=Zingiber officinale TaxID=94328 RepID=A0A8J5G2I9_ZINOF|nr:hypothetical protein ZIOFF_042570 [Zingiber officinale]